MNNAIRNENAKVKQRLTSFFNKKLNVVTNQTRTLSNNGIHWWSCWLELWTDLRRAWKKAIAMFCLWIFVGIA